MYSPSSGHVREVTQGSHDIRSNRDMRDALGALGPVDGINPELSNLTCSLTFVEEGDIVFLTSDGISDNFDPVVGKFCVPVREGDGEMIMRLRPLLSLIQSPFSPVARGATTTRREGDAKPYSPLPSVEAYQRHELTLLRMEDILNRSNETGNGNSNGSSRCNGSAKSEVRQGEKVEGFSIVSDANPFREPSSPRLSSVTAWLTFARASQPPSDAFWRIPSCTLSTRDTRCPTATPRGRSKRCAGEGSARSLRRCRESWTTPPSSPSPWRTEEKRLKTT